MMRILPILVLAAGCASSLSPEQQANLLQQDMQQSTLKISCSSDCDVEYRDPRDRLKLPKQTNGWDFLNTTVSTVGNVAVTAAPWAATGMIAVEGIKNAGSSSNIADSYNQDSTHAPTVVEQPAPTIVEQPAPVLVNPEVVEQPAPVVVQSE